MRAFAASSGRAVVVTLGGEGALAATPDGVLKVEALPVKPVDTVGAGDTFCGYLAASLADGLPLEDALRRAAAAGSLACLKPGAQPSIPLAAEVAAALHPY
jgi:ribokinase